MVVIYRTAFIKFASHLNGQAAMEPRTCCRVADLRSERPRAECQESAAVMNEQAFAGC